MPITTKREVRKCRCNEGICSVVRF
jgi:hypothetical protein